MTPTQVQYHANVEQGRHNRATEKIQRKSNRVQYKNYVEQRRHNKATELETKRSDLANESISLINANEGIRSHQASEANAMKKILSDLQAAYYTADKRYAGTVQAAQINANMQSEIALLNYQLQTELQKIKNSGFYDSTVVSQMTDSIESFMDSVATQLGTDKQGVAKIGVDSILGLFAPDFWKGLGDTRAEITKQIKRWFNQRIEEEWK